MISRLIIFRVIGFVLFFGMGTLKLWSLVVDVGGRLSTSWLDWPPLLASVAICEFIVALCFARSKLLVVGSVLSSLMGFAFFAAALISRLTDHPAATTCRCLGPISVGPTIRMVIAAVLVAMGSVGVLLSSRREQ